MFRDFFQGAAFVFRGIRAFYCDGKAWKYTVLPMLLLLLLYWLVYRWITNTAERLGNSVSDALSGLPSWLLWLQDCTVFLISVSGVVAAMLLLALTVSTMYEIAGGFFFDPLVSYREKQRSGLEPCKLTTAQNIRNILDSIFWGIRTALLFLLFFLLSFFLPLIGQILLVIVMGHRIGQSYLIVPGFNRGMTVAGVQKISRVRYAMTAGFGVTVYLLFLIPFAPLLLLPGIVMGGADLFYDMNSRSQQPLKKCHAARPGKIGG